MTKREQVIKEWERQIAKAETKSALQTLYDALNQGQQKKIVKDEAVKALFDLYGVQYDE